MTGPLSEHLGRVFGRTGLVLTARPGEGAMASSSASRPTRPSPSSCCPSGPSELAQLDGRVAAIHFDRWWNPAVENQATDRAFRIGQQRNVLVHKFVCRGTVEERIDALIEQKKGLAADLLEAGGEGLVTEMSDADVMRIVSLDLRSALAEG
jgi:non-specific serine/threonine protein kinase